MAYKDLYNTIDVFGTKTNTAIDVKGYNSVVFAVTATGTATGTATATLLEGDTAEGLTEVKAEDYLGTKLDITDAGTYKVGYRGTKRYVAVKLTGEGTTAIAILGHALVEPTN